MPTCLALLCLLPAQDGPLLVPPDRIFTPSSQQTVVTPQPTGRIRPFLVQPGYLIETPWLGADDPTPPESDAGPEWMTISFGNDNPYFAFRRQGDPGGVGFFRVASQVQLFDAANTSCAICVNAVAPSGTQFDGLPENRGATVLMPALSLSHAVDDGTWLMMSVGTNLTLQSPTPQPYHRDWQYGFGMCRSLTTDGTSPLRNVYLSVEALGQQRDSLPVTWGLLPGLHWKPANNWTLSGAYAVPMASQPNTQQQQWQIICTVQY
jgi:hypothetical protein